jgi:hypothetical protein
MLSAVHNDDLAPRLSEATCHQLALDLVADDANYKARFAKDYAAYKQYVVTLGKAQAMSHGHAALATAPSTEHVGAAEAAPSVAPSTEVPALEQLNAPSSARSGVPGVAAPASAPAAPVAELEVAKAVLLVPGRVVYFDGREAGVRAVVGDGRMPTLQRIKITQRAGAE